jgi:hypothetical protein
MNRNEVSCFNCANFKPKNVAAEDQPALFPEETLYRVQLDKINCVVAVTADGTIFETPLVFGWAQNKSIATLINWVTKKGGTVRTE